MPVVFLITILAVLVGIFFVATGRGGELAYEHADHAPLDLGPVSAADVALLRPPTAMWGYNMQVTDEALGRIARAMRDRDVTIAYLQDQLAGYERNGSYADYPDYSEYAEPRGAHARQADEALDPPGILMTPGPPTIPDPVELPESPEPGIAAEPAPEPPTAESPAPETPAPEPPAAATAPAPGPPQTALVLKASGPKPERNEPTQPSPTRPDPEAAPDATQPSAVLGEGEEPGEEPSEEPGETTQPSAPLARDDVPGPQGAFDTHGWWAEQQEAARQEQARRQPAGEQDDESVAAAEEQGW